MTLRRLILDFREDGIQLRTLYRRQDGPNPGTKARRREVVDLARSGLTEALRALDAGETEMIGTAGFTTREDILGLEPVASLGEGTRKGGASPFLPAGQTIARREKGA